MTSREFAERIGVSQATVSRALNGSSSVCEKTRLYVQQKAQEYGFVLNSQARSLKTHRTQTIGILFPLYFGSLSSNLMFTHISDHVHRELSALGYDCMMIYHQDPQQKFSTFERVIRSRKVDGLINFRPELLPQELELIQAYRIPFVSLHSALQKNPSLHQLIIDEEDAGFQVGQFLGRQDEGEYMYLAVEDESNEESRRLKGFQEGLASVGKRLDARNILVSQRSPAASCEVIMKHADLFVNRKVHLFVYNDLMALGVINALVTLGVQVPQDVELISMDDLPLATWFAPKLSTMRSPVRQMVRDGSALLLELIEGKTIAPTTTFYRSEMILRETTK